MDLPWSQADRAPLWIQITVKVLGSILLVYIYRTAIQRCALFLQVSLYTQKVSAQCVILKFWHFELVKLQLKPWKYASYATWHIYINIVGTLTMNESYVSYEMYGLPLKTPNRPSVHPQGLPIIYEPQETLMEDASLNLKQICLSNRLTTVWPPQRLCYSVCQHHTQISVDFVSMLVFLTVLICPVRCVTH